ncbi:MAG: sigma-54 dependent transcriptional regulator [Candidatus Eisenbacteria bacterium]|nr:sigma-54 dependent transcriptional regulator [Candidatus Eisenbacteria bacterium]
MATSRILIVDDEAPIRDGLCELLTGWGYDARSAADSRLALELADTFTPQVILSDLMMPGASGLELMAQVREHSPHVAFILLTGHGTIENATQAMREGAYDYLTKPVDLDRLRIVLEKALERVHDRVELVRLTRDLADRGQFGRLVGSSTAMRTVYRLIQQAAPSRASVLITGESGTGKEIVARTIHDMSLRRDKPFIAVSCAAIPETLLESEILGHEKGSFTGATSARAGCFELANGGTLLLDEIGEMPPELQAKLLRVLEERTLRRVGGRQELSVDVRVLSSTNINIVQALREGRFREDLFYRLNVFTVALPPLRERPEDIALLARRFVEDYGRANDKNLSGVTGPAMDRLRQHDWPGNVRELRNVIERAVIVTRHDAIEEEDLPVFAASTARLPFVSENSSVLRTSTVADDGEKHVAPAPIGSGRDPVLMTDSTRRNAQAAATGDVFVPVGTTVLAAEQLLIVETLRSTNQNKTRAAEILGISTKTLHNKLKLYSRSDL